jgi:hypothetical protein
MADPKASNGYQRFLAIFFLLPDFFFLLATRMLSTRLGYCRPAFLADRLAEAFCEAESFFDFLPAFLRGFDFFQGGRGAMRWSSLSVGGVGVR